MFVKAFVFKYFFEVKFWIFLFVVIWSGANLSFRYFFIINYVFEIGECEINLVKGIVFFIKFVV